MGGGSGKRRPSNLTDERAMMLKKIGMELMFTVDHQNDEKSTETLSEAEQSDSSQGLEFVSRKNGLNLMKKKSNVGAPSTSGQRKKVNSGRGSMKRKRTSDSNNHDGHLPLKRTRAKKLLKARVDEDDDVYKKQKCTKGLNGNNKYDESCCKERDLMVSRHIAKYFDTDNDVEELYFGTIVSAGFIKGKYKYTVVYDDDEEEHISGKRIGKMIRLYNENKESDVRFLRQDHHHKKLKKLRRDVTYWKVATAELRMELGDIETEHRSEIRGMKKQIKELKALVAQRPG